MTNQLTKLYNALSEHVTGTRDAFGGRVQRVRETSSALYNRMMQNMGYGQERLKDIVEKEAEEEQQQEEDWRKDPWVLRFIPDGFKTQEMCTKALEVGLWKLKDVPDHFKTQEISDSVVRRSPFYLKDVPDHFKTQEMCDDAVRRNPFYLLFVPDWFVTQEQIDVWYDDKYWYQDDWLIKWYDDYKKRKTQRAKVKDELMPIAWHPDRVMDWCMSEDEKRWWK